MKKSKREWRERPTRVVELVEIHAAAKVGRVADGTPLHYGQCGFFSSMKRATKFLRRRVKREQADGPTSEQPLLHYYIATRYKVDDYLQAGAVRVFEPDGRIRGQLPEPEAPFTGRPASDCKFHVGDLVAFAYGEQFRIGIVCAEPPTPEFLKAPFEAMDDCYLVGLCDPKGYDHDHVHEPLLWPAPKPLDPGLVERLHWRLKDCQGRDPRPAAEAANGPDAIVDRILSRFRRKDDAEPVGSARAVLVVDSGLHHLGEPLREADFMVVTVDSSLSGFADRSALLAGRILVTRQTEYFLDDAPALCFGIIGLDALPEVGDSADYARNGTAQMASKAIAEFDLPNEKGAFVLMLKPNGDHVFKRIA